MNKIKKFNENKNELLDYINDMSDNLDNVEVEWESDRVLISIPHTFYGDSALSDFKKYKEIINKIDITISILLKNNYVKEVRFEERSNYSIDLIILI